METGKGETWRVFWEQRRNREVALLSLCFLVAVLALLRLLIPLVEGRPGVELPDPVLASFTPVDLNWPIFALVYGSILLGLAGVGRRPRPLLITVQAYALLMLLRCTTLWLIPLEEPATMILLRDPIVQTLLHVHHPPAKDLFFSGHVATAFLLALTASERQMKQVQLAAALLIALMLASQHVHYTIDLVAAPFFALGSYRAALLLRPGRL